MTPETKSLIETLSWMITDLNFRREQTGLDAAPLSPEMQTANQQLADLRSGKLVVTKGV